MNKPATTQYEIHKLLKERWSPRAFSSRPVEHEKLMRLFEAARWSPSAANIQPWSFIVVTKENPELHQKFVELLSGRNPDWAANAPVLVVAVAKLNQERPALNKYAYYDLGQAVSHLTVEATHAGLHVHQMGGFDSEKARELFEIPQGYEPVTVMALGYFGRAEDLPEDLLERERLPRTRKPLNEFVFNGHWAYPLETGINDNGGNELPLSA
ncbi:MAG TPA: nitroreductase family protein [Chloroflexia bacterium]|nr:nitroreductase family protein [Chloroflexia bacterium]